MTDAEIESMTDDDLLESIMVWVRIYRSEGQLYGEERVIFKKKCAEAVKRKLIRTNGIINIKETA